MLSAIPTKLVFLQHTPQDEKASTRVDNAHVRASSPFSPQATSCYSTAAVVRMASFKVDWRMVPDRGEAADHRISTCIFRLKNFKKTH